MSTNPYEPPAGHDDYKPEQSESTESAGAIAYGVVVRSFGLISVFYGLWYASVLVYHALGIPEEAPGDNATSFIGGAMLVVFGMLVIGFAKGIVRLSYQK